MHLNHVHLKGGQNVAIRLDGNGRQFALDNATKAIFLCVLVEEW